MKKRYWIAGMVLAVVVALGVLGGAMLAQGRGSDDGDGMAAKRSFAARVADILGLQEATVQDAMDQAREDMATERLSAYLDAMVEKGTITREQADQALAWQADRPDGIKAWLFAGKAMATEQLSAYLDTLVEKEVITREQADQALEWYGDRPDGIESWFSGKSRAFADKESIQSFHHDGKKGFIWHGSQVFYDKDSR